MPPKENWLCSGMSALWIILSLGACASAPPTVWKKLDGKPVAEQFELDKTVCRGEMQKTALIQREEKIYFPGEENPLLTIFEGCMAQRGYVKAK